VIGFGRNNSKEEEEKKRRIIHQHHLRLSTDSLRDLARSAGRHFLQTDCLGKI
jgi:hypothetical protein